MAPLVYAGGVFIVHQEDAMRRPGGIVGIIIALIVIFIALRIIGLI